MAESELAGVLFDRDGTLIEDVPYNGDPALVRLMPTAAAALDLVRRAGLAAGMVSNQSGVASGLLTHAAVGRVNARVQRLLGRLSVCLYCPHAAQQGCRCRKPAPGMVLDAAARLALPPGRLALVGDIGADMGAAAAAGARAVLVPTSATRAAEIRQAPAVAATLLDAVRLLLGTGGPR